MRFLRSSLVAVLFAGIALSMALGETFATFPNQKELASADHRYVLRSMDPVKEAADFTGTFHSLVVEDRVTGQSRKLFDYVQKIAVAWSDKRVVATDYHGRRGSRALVFSVDPNSEGYMVDRNDLAERVPEIQPQLHYNDHVFIEAVRVEGSLFEMRVWGYGTRDRNGFRYRCTLNLDRGNASCQEQPRAEH